MLGQGFSKVRPAHGDGCSLPLQQGQRRLRIERGFTQGRCPHVKVAEQAKDESADPEERHRRPDDVLRTEVA